MLHDMPPQVLRTEDLPTSRRENHSPAKFWELMDRWKLPTKRALELIGEEGYAESSIGPTNVGSAGHDADFKRWMLIRRNATEASCCSQLRIGPEFLLTQDGIDCVCQGLTELSVFYPPDSTPRLIVGAFFCAVQKPTKS